MRLTFLCCLILNTSPWFVTNPTLKVIVTDFFGGRCHMPSTVSSTLLLFPTISALNRIINTVPRCASINYDFSDISVLRNLTHIYLCPINIHTHAYAHKYTCWLCGGSFMELAKHAGPMTSPILTYQSLLPPLWRHNWCSIFSFLKGSGEG